MQQTKLKQRADYTYRFNRDLGRHGWLRLTPAYSVRVVEEILATGKRGNVLDPFCGTATTPLCATLHGRDAMAIELNPFLTWFARTKLATYTEKLLDETRFAARGIVANVQRGNAIPAPVPALHNIERWWHTDTLQALREIKGAIDDAGNLPAECIDLLLTAFCRTLIEVSNAAFNHQSMSFKDSAQEDLPLGQSRDTALDVFFAALNGICHSAEENPVGKAQIVLGDSRDAGTLLDDNFDLVMTSPPYPNRMSYIRELRPYMYWLGYLESGRDAGELDWRAIGGTWGIATSRLAEWERDEGGFYPGYFRRILEKIAHVDNANGNLLANYIARYFEDMYRHLSGLTKRLNAGAELHYIIGNSTFYGVLLPVEKLYVDIMKRLGYDEIVVRTLRKRNSKKELLEFDVSARWSG